MKLKLAKDKSKSSQRRTKVDLEEMKTSPKFKAEE